jgi:hypothetical protein
VVGGLGVVVDRAARLAEAQIDVADAVVEAHVRLAVALLRRLDDLEIGFDRLRPVFLALEVACLVLELRY